MAKQREAKGAIQPDSIRHHLGELKPDRRSKADEQNDIPSGLERYLAPTDCRLRTDQRAFENAEYDRAQA